MRVASTLGIASLLLSVAAAKARASDPGEPGIESVENVVITGRLEEDLPLDLEKIGTRIDVVSDAQIRDAGAIDVAQALQSSIPGLYISPKNGPFDYADVSFLGSRTSDILWLVDGVRINNRLYGGTTPLDTLPAAMVERIVLLEGPQALFYGTQAVAGAVNVVTRSFAETPGGGLSLGADTNQGKHADGYFRDTLAGQHFVLFASDDQSAGLRPFRAQDFQPSTTDRHRSYNIRTAGVKYAIDPVEDLRLSASYQHTEGHVDFAVPEFVATAFNDRDEDILSGKLDYTPGSAVQLFAKAYLHHWRSHYTELDNVPGEPGALEVIDSHDFWGFKDTGVNAAVKLALNTGFEYYLGADYQSYSGNDAVLVITRKAEHVRAFFGQVATTPELLAKASFAAGFRYNDPSFGPAATVWSLSGRIDVARDLFVRFLAATAFRLPTAEELFADDPNDERGSPALRPERSRNLNAAVGGTAVSGRVKWEVGGFLRDIDDLISFDGFDPATNQSLAQNIAGTVRVRGAELTVEAAATADLALNASYTYSHSRQEGDQQIARVPEQLAKRPSTGTRPQSRSVLRLR